MTNFKKKHHFSSKEVGGVGSFPTVHPCADVDVDATTFERGKRKPSCIVVIALIIKVSIQVRKKIEIGERSYGSIVRISL